MSRFNTAALLLLCIGVCAAGPTLARKRHHRPKQNRQPQPCTVTDCFTQPDVRRYDVIDNRTVIVYTGARQCPFRVDLAGYECRLNVGPSLNFVQVTPLATGVISGILRGTDPFQDYSPFPGRSAQDYFDPVYRVCRGMPRLIAYMGPRALGPDTPISTIPGLSDACEVVDVHALNDNQVIELYVKRKLAPPPPPVGPGTLSVPTPAASPAAGGTNQPSSQPANQSAPAGQKSTPAQGAPAQ